MAPCEPAEPWPAAARLRRPRRAPHLPTCPCRDKDHGIGPKRLQTIVSIVLQQQLLSWLDACQQDMEAAVRAAAQVKDAAAASVSHGSMGTSASAGNEVAVVGASTPASPIQAALAAIKSGLQRSPSNVHAQGSSGGGGSSGGIAAVREGVAVQEEVQHSGYATPHTGAAAPPVARALPQTAGTADEQSAPSPFARAQQTSSTQSAPATPLRPVLGGTAIAPPPASVPAPQALTAHARPNRLSSLHGYMGLLSVKASGRRSLSVENLAGLRLPDGSQPRSLPLDAAPREQLPSSTQRGTEGLARQLSSPPSFSGAGEARGAALAATEGISAGGGLAPRGRFLSEQHAGGPQLTVVTGSLHHGSRPGHRRSASAASASVLGVLTSLRGRLRASENGAASGGAPGVLAATAAGPAAVCAAATLVELPQALDKEPLKSEKDLSEGEEEAGPSGSEASAEEAECGVCLDHGVEVAFASCQHKLCISCARNLTAQARKPPHCPFCRKVRAGVCGSSAVLLDLGLPRQSFWQIASLWLPLRSSCLQTVYAFTRLEVPPRPATAMPVHICAH